MFRAVTICSRAIFNNNARLCNSVRFKSNISEDRIAITDDGSTVVCWHPKKSFPYEFTKSLPAEVIPEHSVLKVENKSDVYDIFKTKKEAFMIEELRKITHTTKHRWYPNSMRHRKLFKKIKGDREYL